MSEPNSFESSARSGREHGEAFARAETSQEPFHLVASCSAEEARHLAFHDALTGLANRRSFDAALRSACERGRVALCLLDMDRFKAVNDSLGHSLGDALLQKVAERLTGSTRAHDFVARLAGDEFACIFEDVTDEANATDAAERILAALRARFDLGEVALQANMTAGLTLAAAGEDPATVFRRADVALHRAKLTERGSVRLQNDDAARLSAHHDLMRLKALLTAPTLPLQVAPIVGRDAQALAREACVLAPTDASFDALCETAARFGLADDLAGLLIGSAADIADAENPVHVRLPMALAEQHRLDEHVLLAARRRQIAPTALVVGLPLQALARTPAQRTAERLAADGFGHAILDWDFSLEAFHRAGARGVVMVSIEASRLLPMLAQPATTAVVSAALASLSAMGVRASVRGVGAPHVAARMLSVGVDALHGENIIDTLTRTRRMAASPSAA